MILTSDNTLRMGPAASYSTPKSFLRQQGLMGLGELLDPATGLPVNPETGEPYTQGSTSGTSAPDATDRAVALFNAESVFITNLIRQIQGKPPINPQTNAPRFNVGLATDTQKTLGYVVGGVAAIWLITSLLKRR